MTVSLHKSTGSFDKGRGISGYLPEIPEENGTQYLPHLNIILQILKFNSRSFITIVIIIINNNNVHYVYLFSLLVSLFYESHYT